MYRERTISGVCNPASHRTKRVPIVSSCVFERLHDGSYSETSRLVPSDSNGGDKFGFSAAAGVSALVVGAAFDGADDHGSANVFQKDFSGSWVQKDKLIASVSDAENYGVSVGASLGWCIRRYSGSLCL